MPSSSEANAATGTASQTMITAQLRDKIIKLQTLATHLDWRLKTFSEPWPYPHNTKKLNGTTLAKANIDINKIVVYRIQVDDENDDSVFCPFCFKGLSEFEGSDVPMAEHKGHQPKCVFVNQ